MFQRTKTVFALALALSLAAGTAAAQDAAWRIVKSSGEAWVTTGGAEPVSLSGDATLKPGDIVRTGPSGRVLLSRGAESILVTANTVMTVAPDKKSGVTSILQQAGSILLDVEKKNVQHFEVATPYLAAVVKGTQFRVTVNQRDSQVDVMRGTVQVTDYRTGQFAMVNAEQSAKVSTQGRPGLTLTGAGTLNPIEQGDARTTPVPAINIPPGGFMAPRPQNAQNGGQNSGQPVRVVSALGQVELPASNGQSGGATNVSDVINGLFSFNGKKSRDDLTIALAVPVAAGFLVAVGSAVVRRRKKKDKNDADRQ